MYATVMRSVCILKMQKLKKKFNEIKNGNYRCSDMEKAREQFQAEMNEMIKGKRKVPSIC